MIYTQTMFYEFSKITVPTLLMIGDQDDTAIRKDFAPPRIRAGLENYPGGLPQMNGILSLAQASTIVDKALEHGKTLGLPPLTVAVLDGAGCLVSFKREDGSSLLRPEIAQAKAFGTLAMGMGSRAIEQRASVAPAFISAVNALAGGRIIPVPGGVLIRSGKLIVGAVGITGAKSEQDEACATTGITAAGFTADTGAETAP